MRLSRVLVALVVVGVCVPMATAATLEMSVAARWVGPSGVVPVTEGTVIDAAYNPYLLYDVAVRVSEGDNMGLGGVVFNTFSAQMAAQGLYMWSFYDAEGGYNSTDTGVPALQDIKAAAYPAAQPSLPPASYAGGWGFDGSGFPTGGVATAPGQVLNAGNSLPLIWSGDNAPGVLFPGIQSFALMGVGQGTNVGRAEDPVFGGIQLGRTQVDNPETVDVDYADVPQDLANGVVPGDGEWVMFRAFLPLAGMAIEDGKGAILYTVDIVPTDGNWLMFPADFTGDSVGSTYYDELQGGFRAPFTGGDMTGDSFSFYIPEPATVGLLLVGGLALVRRRR